MSVQSVLMIGSVPLVAALAARRASARGASPEPIAHQLVPGLLIAIPIAIYALLIGGQRWAPFGSVAGSATLQVGLVVALLAGVAGVARTGLPLLLWGDICAPAVLLGQAAVALAAAVELGLPASLTFKALWHLGALWVLLAVERRLGDGLRQGDLLLLYSLLTASGALLST